MPKELREMMVICLIILSYLLIAAAILVFKEYKNGKDKKNKK